MTQEELKQANILDKEINSIKQAINTLKKSPLDCPAGYNIYVPADNCLRNRLLLSLNQRLDELTKELEKL